MFNELLILIVSLLVLDKASGTVLDNLVKLASRARVGSIVIGFIGLSVVTSLPETSISLTAATINEPQIVSALLMGANITDLALVLGLLGLMSGKIVARRKVLHDVVLLMLLTTIIPLLLLFYGDLGRVGATLLVTLFLVYSVFLTKQEILEPKVYKSKFNKLAVALLIIFGLALVIFSSRFALQSALALSEQLGLSRRFLGSVILALGTSLPETVVGYNAIKKGHTDIALGTIVGACLVRITLVLGLAGMINPAVMSISSFPISAVFLIIINLLFWYVLTERKGLHKRESIVFVFIYLLYMLVQFGRESL